MAVLYLDVDRFKSINDTLGHSAGDLVLMHTAARINSTLRSGDIASRFGGDEFVAAFAVTGAENAASIVGRLQAVLGAPLDFAGRTFAVSCSIGMSTFPDDAEDADGLIAAADAAMYAAKQSGRSTWRATTPPFR